MTDSILKVIENIGLEVSFLVRRTRNKVIRVVFVCARPAIWNSLKSVCEACIRDERFDVTIVAIPNKQYVGNSLSHERYISEGAEDFFSSYSCKVINGYDYKKKIWIDIKSLHPDYVFFQTPYNICRPPQYSSKVVRKYAKLCYIPYGIQMLGSEVEDSVFPADFMHDVSYGFADSKNRVERIFNYMTPTNAGHMRALYLGFPRFDQYYEEFHKGTWIKQDSFHILWTPRWTTSEGNCNFFDYKDKIVDYVEKKENSELVFRPHPQLFSYFVATGEITKEELEAYKGRYAANESLQIEEGGDYIPNLCSANVVVSDETSLLAEYIYSEVPIIFCVKKETHFTPLAEELSKGFYWAETFEDVEKYLDRIRVGIDPLKKKRLFLKKQFFSVPKGGSGYKIKEYLKHEFLRK